ncbi:MAG: toll/interleukin-1 receptor domain-containing protein, partial [Planctomycetes bacterium]|nr:toll/interleukin-1 receptor domain-containing protein [Planctomycetota bacterium]
MIFIAYRRSDTAFLVGRLADRLIQSFGSDAVFHDVRSVRPGDDFVGLSEATVRSSKVVLAVVGDGWLSLQDGVRRIDRPDDYLRIELENALRSRPNTCVIPVYTSDNCVLTTKTGL